jgi:hypothetical protein
VAWRRMTARKTGPEDLRDTLRAILHLAGIA